MTFDVNQLEKYRVLKNDTTDTSKVLETQKYNFLEGIESEILKLIDQDEFICIDNNIEDLKSVSSDTIEKINNNVELKKYILTYLFWKYKGTKNNIKKAFGIKHGEQLEDCIYHIKYKKTCPLCGGYGEVSLESSSRKRKTFICNSCGHTDQTFDEKYKNRDSYLYCECNYCRDVREKLRKCYSDWILENLKECENIIKELPIYMDKVDDKTMKRHAKIQSSNLCSDSREILAYEPTSIEELEEIKKDIAELSRYSSAEKYLNTIDEILIDKKIVYKYFKKKELIDPFDLMWYFLGTASYCKGRERINKLLDEINNSDDFFKKINDYSNYKFEMGNTEYSLRLDADRIITRKIINDETIKKCCYDEKLILNHYFYDTAFLAEEEEKDANLNPKSNSEESLYDVLLNKYPKSDGYSVINNPRLSKYIDMNYIEFLFKDHRANYVSRCYVDFLILKDGIPCKVYELQKGDHHNTTEWIEKDKMKKGACLVSGLEFEEYF